MRFPFKIHQRLTPIALCLFCLNSKGQYSENIFSLNSVADSKINSSLVFSPLASESANDNNSFVNNNYTTFFFAPPVNLPGRIQAESWDAKSGSQYPVTTNDVGGGQHVVGMAINNYMDYNVNVTGAGTYNINFRIATTQAHAQFQVKSGTTILGTINIPNTGDWSNWQTVTLNNITLTAGTQTIRVTSTNTESCNFNWFEFVAVSVGNLSPTANAGSNQTIALPTTTTTLVGSGNDPDGTIASYGWSQVGASDAIISMPGSPTTSITGLTTIGVRTFRLTVTDNLGATGTSDVTVTVNGAPALPNVNTNNPQNITVNTASLTSNAAGNGGIVSTKWTKFSGPGQTLKTVTVIGSSTAAGNGVTSGDSSFVNRLKAYYVGQGIINDIINLAVAGTSPFDINITSALNYNSDIMLVSYPSNGYTASMNAAALAKLQEFKDSCDKRGVDFYITGTQPRNDFSPADRSNLIVMNDSMRLRFGDRYIDFLTPLLNPANNNIKDEFYADGIHPNNSGHEKLYQLVKGANIFRNRISSPSVISSPSAGNTTITGLTNGVNKFQIAIIDNLGYAASAVATINVNLAGNQPPTANAGINQTITLPTSSASLTGSGSDVDGTIASYAWSQVGASDATITSPGLASTTVTGMTTAGVRTFRLTVTDNLGLTGTSNVTVTVTDPANQLPTANAGANQIISLPNSTVTLNGSGTDPDGTISAYAWTQVSGNAATISTPALASTTITGLTAGIRVFKLTVTDNKGGMGSGNVTITVNIPPTANAGTKQTITQPAATVSLTGSGTDADGTISSYAWAQVSGTVASITTPAQATTAITGLTTVGARVFRLTVTDNNGASGTSDVTVNVNPLSNGKTIPGRIETENWDIKSGGMYAVATNDVGGGQHVVGIGNGNYMDYNVNVTSTGVYTVAFRIATTQTHAQFQIKSGATVLSTINIANTGDWGIWQTVFGTSISLTAGVQTIRVISTNTESCNFNWFEFAPQGNLSPTANAGSNQTVILPTSTVTLNGSATDADGTVTGYSWSQTGGIAATITTPGQPSTTITGLTTSGVRTFRLTATDNNGANGTSDVTITVNDPAANIPPTANAGATQTITLPASSVSLTGTGSDPDGTVNGYAWTQVGGTTATITTPASPSTTITGLTTAGTRIFRLTVTDNNGAMGTSDVTINVNPLSNGKTIPGRIETESWDARSGGFYAVNTNDIGGGQHVVGIANGNYMDYNVTVTSAGTYTVTFRIATTQNNSQFQIKSGATILGTMSIPNTGDWSTWRTTNSIDITLAAGAQVIRVQSTNNESCNFNWMEFALSSGGSFITSARSDESNDKNEIAEIRPLSIYPDPFMTEFNVTIPLRTKDNVMIAISDLSGNVIYQKKYDNLAVGNNIVRIQPGKNTAMVPGVYIVRVMYISAGDRQTFKLIKQ